MTSPSFDSRESTTLSPRCPQYGHFIQRLTLKAQLSRAPSRGMSLLRLIGQAANLRDVQPFLRGEQQPEDHRRRDRKEVDHNRGADRRIVRRAEERRRT